MDKLTNRILLIDDNLDNLTIMEDLIQHAFPGYGVLSASSGIKGLALAASDDPDVILLDVVMPGMNGFEVCQKLKSNPKTSLIPVVFLTSIKGDREARIQAVEVGAEAFLSRPVDESELIAQIRAMQKIKHAASLQQDEKENLTSLVEVQTQALRQAHTASLNLLEDLHAENEARKKNEAALRESEERFRTLIEKAPVAIYISRNGIGLYANQKDLQMFGVASVEEIIGRPVTDFLAPQSIDESLERTHRRALGLPTSVEIETVGLRRDGSRFPVQVTVDSVQLSDGPANLSFITDITERMNAEKLLKESEERYKLMFESSPLAINITHGSEISYANPSYLKMFGLASLDDLKGFAPLELFTPEWRAHIQDNIERRTKGLPVPDFYEAECFRRDGSRFPVQMYLSRTTFSDGPATVGFILDISERKQAQVLQQAIYQIAAAAETVSSLDELYPQIHKAISSVMPAENFFIALYDEAQNLLRFPYFKDPKDDSFVNGVQPGKGTTAYVLRTGKSLLCTRELHAELERMGEVKLRGVPSAIWLGVPLIVEGKTIGAMVVQHYSDPHAYGEREQRILEFVSAQVATAIDRKQAEAALQESERRYRGLFEHSPISLWEEDFSAVKHHIEELRLSGVTDYREFFENHPDELLACVHEIKVVDVNAATLTLMHAGRNDLLAGNLEQVIRIKPDLDFVDELVHIAEGRTEFAWDGTNYTLDGEKLSVSLRWSAAPGYENSLEKVLVSMVDITDRKQAEDQIRQLNASLEERVEARTRELRNAQEQLVRHEKLAMLGQLAGGVGHELRNPLGVINSAVYYLKLVQPDADEKIKKYHSIIEQEVNTAGRIINDLLDFGRIVSPDCQPVSIPELIQHVLTRFPPPPTVRVKLNLPASLPRVFVDQLHLEQVLGNLATNACQAMKDRKDGGKLTISASLKKNQVAIAIKDTGTGIRPENMPKLFEPLFTTKLRGIGLGLAVSKKLAEANGGSIAVRSEPGKGSTFTVYLPVKGDQ